MSSNLNLSMGVSRGVLAGRAPRARGESATRGMRSAEILSAEILFQPSPSVLLRARARRRAQSGSDASSGRGSVALDVAKRAQARRAGGRADE